MSSLPASYATSLGGILRSNSNSAGSVSTNKLRPSLPTHHRALSGALSTRAMDIYALSDSEDEAVELVKPQGGFVTARRAPLIKSEEEKKSRLQYVVRI